MRRVALVFDDGPGPEDTALLLGVLGREGVRATFSLVGNRALAFPGPARDVVSRGHEVANHSLSHAHPSALSDEALAQEVVQSQAILAGTIGATPRWYWPPYLEKDPRLPAIVDGCNLRMYEPRHLVSSLDYDRSVDAAQIRRNATQGVVDGSIVLFHEWREETRTGLPGILADLRGLGSTFHTLSGLETAFAGRATA